MSDMTVNVSGPSNMCPPPKEWSDGVTALIDGFIKDGWIDPENRMTEIAMIYRGQRDASWREIRQRSDRQDRKIYAANWVERWLTDQMALRQPTPPSPSGARIRRET